jgi:hypothetical protein
MSKTLGDVLSGGSGLKSHAGQTLTITAFDVEEDENGKETVAISASNGDGETILTRTTSGVVIRQLYALKAENMLPATVRVDEVPSRSGRNYLSLAVPPS